MLVKYFTHIYRVHINDTGLLMLTTQILIKQIWCMLAITWKLQTLLTHLPAYIRHQTFHSQQCSWIYRLRNDGHVVQGRYIKTHPENHQLVSPVGFRQNSIRALWTKWSPFHTFKCIFMKEKFCISVRISQQFVPESQIGNNSSLVQVMALRRIGANPLPQPKLTQFTDAYMWHKGEMSLKPYVFSMRISHSSTAQVLKQILFFVSFV